MFASFSNSEQPNRHESLNQYQNERQRRSQPTSKSTQSLSDLTMTHGVVQMPETEVNLREFVSVSENGSPHLLSENNNVSDEPTVNLYQWFEDFNKHPEKAVSKYGDAGSPYFLQQNSSNSSRGSSETTQLSELARGCRGGSSDDFRSVIDDLTIENKMLREKLRRYKKQFNRQLEKDKLFEIRIHDLPPAKRRELETALRSFASSIDYSSCELREISQNKSKKSNSSNETVGSSRSKLSYASTLNSRLDHSSYTSLLTSNMPTTLNSGVFSPGKNKNSKLIPTDSRNCHNSHRDCQQSLFPKHGLKHMSDQEKKKHVVQRLEQLFTGGKGVMMGVPGPVLNQTEKLNSSPDNELTTNPSGIREAHMIPQDNYNSLRASDSLHDPEAKNPSDLSDETNSNISFSNQRPTFPLELDPDRAQVPSDNVEYIRHLGLSTPQLANEEYSDTTTDKGGWVYLNLLINMAQLHIINVTTDFIRSAVNDVSEKFELSRDGKMIRWKGENKASRIYNFNSSSSISLDYESSKSSDQDLFMIRGKDKMPTRRPHSNTSNQTQNSSSSEFHYKPLFYHRSPSENLSEISGSLVGMNRVDESVSTMNLWSRYRNSRYHNSTMSKKQREDGSLVFYRGAEFCVDLSGDPESALFQLSNLTSEEESDIDQEFSHDSLAPRVERTLSGCSLPYRPFKEPPRQSDSHEIDRLDSSPTSSEKSSDFRFDLAIFPSTTPQKSIPLQKFGPCGIGATRPSDHFGMRVLTQQSVINSNTIREQSPNLLNIEQRLKDRLSNSLPREVKNKEAPNSLNDNAMTTNYKSTIPSHKMTLSKHLPVQTKIISLDFFHLPPSKFPSPSMLQYSSDSDAEPYTTVDSV